MPIKKLAFLCFILLYFACNEKKNPPSPVHISDRNEGFVNLEKDHNGLLHNPHIDLLIQDPDNSNTVIAIQRNVRENLGRHQHYLYRSEDFGLRWALLADTNVRNEILNRDEVLPLIKASQSKLVSPTELRSALRVNEQFILSKDFRKGLLLTDNQSETVITLIDINHPMYKEVPDFRLGTWSPPIPPLYISKLEKGKLEVLFGSTSGGIKYFKYDLE